MGQVIKQERRTGGQEVSEYFTIKQDMTQKDGAQTKGVTWSRVWRPGPDVPEQVLWCGGITVLLGEASVSMGGVNLVYNNV